MPSFLTPDTGLLFWMLIAFIVVFSLLAKYGFPVITDMVEKRKKFIDESLSVAREANEKLANIKAECDTQLKEAQTRQSQIVNDAIATRDKIIREAKDKAQAESARILDEARKQIEVERQKAKLEAREEVAELSIKIAAKVLSKQLEKEQEQSEWIDNVLNEISASK
ncbi:MAG: F0F1 ATP synthase subunit B [Prevotellaceae bacterium]|nr:F0F1 ATP synthase subunit B [Candidatus Faecinaster equi]